MLSVVDTTSLLPAAPSEWQQASRALEDLAHRHGIIDGGLRLPVQNGRPLHVEAARLCSTAADLELGTQIALALSLRWGDVWCRIEKGHIAGERFDLHRVVLGRDLAVVVPSS